MHGDDQETAGGLGAGKLDLKLAQSQIILEANLKHALSVANHPGTHSRSRSYGLSRHML